MDVLRTVKEMQAHAEEERRAGQRLALVPTMGALHEGHLALVREAKRRAGHVTASIFVNPTQFAPEEDLEKYPRDLEGDLEKLDTLGVAAVFAPAEGEMYPETVRPEETLTWVAVERLDAHLCGRYRPGHFRGVTTVVAKLFNICRPHVAVFGQKDAQQLVILRRMARDLHMGVEVVGVPIQRAPDGLALSSRNAYLSPEERRQAPVLSKAVAAARACIEAGEQRISAIVETMHEALAQAPAARVQYAEVVDACTLQPLDRAAPGQDLLAAVAVFFGETRLIDNAFATAPASS